MKKCLPALSVLLFIVGVWMMPGRAPAQVPGMFQPLLMASSRPIAWDASSASTSPGTNSANTLDLTSLTVSSGLVNGAIYACVALSQTGGTSPVLQWNATGTPQSFTLKASFNGGSGRSEAWELKNPTAGNKTLRYTYTGTAGNIIMNAASFNNVGTGYVSNTTNTGTSTLTTVGPLTVAAGGASFDCPVNPGNLTTPRSQTLVGANSAQSVIAAGMQYNVGTTNPTFSWTNVNTTWATMAVVIAQ